MTAPRIDTLDIHHKETREPSGLTLEVHHDAPRPEGTHLAPTRIREGDTYLTGLMDIHQLERWMTERNLAFTGGTFTRNWTR